MSLLQWLLLLIGGHVPVRLRWAFEGAATAASWALTAEPPTVAEHPAAPVAAASFRQFALVAFAGTTSAMLSSSSSSYLLDLQLHPVSSFEPKAAVSHPAAATISPAAATLLSSSSPKAPSAVLPQLPLCPHGSLLSVPSIFPSRSISFSTQLKCGQQQDQQHQVRQQQQQELQQPEATGHQKQVRLSVKQAADLKAFEERLYEVKAYVARHGGLPPCGYHGTKSKIQLRKWLHRMRVEHVYGILPSEMAAAVDEALGDVWRKYRFRERSFKEMLGRLKNFQESRGRLPMHREADADEVKIGHWINLQRTAYKRGRIPAERVAALEAIPGWAWRLQVRTDDEVWLEKIWEFEKANGRLPRSTETWDGMRVGRWVDRKRKSYKQGLLSQEEIATCESLPGWVWAMHSRRCGKVPFDVGLGALKKYVRTHGQLPSTLQVGDDPRKLHLGTWISACRHRRKRGKLTPDQIAALEEVPGWWWECPRPFRLY